MRSFQRGPVYRRLVAHDAELEAVTAGDEHRDGKAAAKFRGELVVFFAFQPEAFSVPADVDGKRPRLGFGVDGGVEGVFDVDKAAQYTVLLLPEQVDEVHHAGLA